MEFNVTHLPASAGGGGADRCKVTRCDLRHLLKLGQRLEAPADADVICSVQSGSLPPTPPPPPTAPLIYQHPQLLQTPSQAKLVECYKYN